MLTFLATLTAVSMMLPLLWAVPDMVDEATPVESPADVRLVARHRRSLRRQWRAIPVAAFA